MKKYLVTQIDRLGETHECLLCEECVSEMKLVPPHINGLVCTPADSDIKCEICNDGIELKEKPWHQDGSW